MRYIGRGWIWTDTRQSHSTHSDRRTERDCHDDNDEEKGWRRREESWDQQMEAAAEWRQRKGDKCRMIDMPIDTVELPLLSVAAVMDRTVLAAAVVAACIVAVVAVVVDIATASAETVIVAVVDTAVRRDRREGERSTAVKDHMAACDTDAVVAAAPLCLVSALVWPC